MLKIKNNKGFTLVEVLISIVILSIIIFSFLHLFGSGFISIFSMGIKDRALAEASDIMEKIYNKQEAEGGLSGISEIEGIINEISPSLEFFDSYSISEILPFENNNDDIKGYKVTINVTFQSGDVERQASLTSFFRGK